MNENDSTSITFKQVYGDIKGALDAIADSLKTGAEHVYAVLVRQQAVNSLTYLLIDMSLVLVSIITWRMVHKFYKAKKSRDWEALYVVPSIITLFCIIAICATLNDIITGFVNPEYGAIMEIKSFIK